MITMLSRYFFGSLRRQLIFGVAFVHAVLMAVFIVDLTQKQKSVLLNHQTEHAISLARSIATSSANGVISHDIVGLQEIADTQSEYPNLSFAMMTNTTGQVLAHTDQTKIGQYVSDMPKEAVQKAISHSPELVDVAAPIIISNRHEGWARVGISQLKTKQNLDEIAVSGSVYALAAILIGSFFAWCIGKRITRRLYELKAVMNNVIAGKTDSRSNLTGFDEASELAVGFNSMLATLSKQDETQRALLNTANAGIIMTDRCGKYVLFNKWWSEHLGYEAEELKKLTNQDITHPDDRELSKKYFSKVIEGEIDSYHIEKRFVRKDASFFWGDIYVSPIRNDLNEVINMVGIIADITEQKQIENELRESEKKSALLSKEIEAILNSSPVGVTYLKDRKILRANRAFEAIFGYEPGQCLGMDTIETYASKRTYDDLGEAAYPVINSGKIFTIDAEMKKADGSLIWGTISGQVLTPEKPEDGSIWTVMDITEKKRAEEASIELKKQFEQTQRLESLGVLAGGIAHDFNNILTIILGHCYVASDESISAPDIKTHIQQIESASHRAAALCRQMLIYAGKNPLSKTRINMWVLVDEVLRLLQPAIKSNVTFELRLKRDIPEFTGDNTQLQQVVMNMIINASEAIGDNYGTIKVVTDTVTISGEENYTDYFGVAIPVGRYAGLEVSDSGCGMDENTQRKIFEPFFTTKFTGRGLGMSAILGIIKSHNGALQLTSRPGIGSRFKIYLPLPEVEEMANHIAESPSLPSYKASGTVLLVDDEPELLNIGSTLLSAMGYSVLTASNGRESINIYLNSETEIKLILLDLTMPEMGGLDAYHELRRISPTKPIVLCSGFNVDDVSAVIEGDVHAAVIQKPFKLDQLRKVLSEQLNRLSD